MNTDNPFKPQETVAQQLMQVLYDNLTTLRVPWAITPEITQREILDRMKSGIDAAVRKAVADILSAASPKIIGTLSTITAKDGIKALILLPRESDMLHQLIDRVGSKVMVVMADMDQYTEGMDKFRATADQMNLLGDEDVQSN